MTSLWSSSLEAVPFLRRYERALDTHVQKKVMDDARGSIVLRFSCRDMYFISAGSCNFLCYECCHYGEGTVAVSRRFGHGQAMKLPTS